MEKGRPPYTITPASVDLAPAFLPPGTGERGRPGTVAPFRTWPVPPVNPISPLPPERGFGSASPHRAVLIVRLGSTEVGSYGIRVTGAPLRHGVTGAGETPHPTRPIYKF